MESHTLFFYRRYYIQLTVCKHLSERLRNNVKKYPTINDIPHLISKTGKTLIYIPWIENMKNIRDRIAELGVECECIWSINSKTMMIEKQLKVRDFVLNTGKLLQNVHI